MRMTNPTGTAIPAARFDGLITTESDHEVIVYDETSRHIHHLNEVSAVIWRLCDGARGVTEIATAATAELDTEVSEDAVRVALRKLEDATLLDGSLDADIRGTAQSRRSFMKKAAKMGAIAVPAVVSITAPLASASATGTCTNTCSKKNESNCCPCGISIGACVNAGQPLLNACIGLCV